MKFQIVFFLFLVIPFYGESQKIRGKFHLEELLMISESIRFKSNHTFKTHFSSCLTSGSGQGSYLLKEDSLILFYQDSVSISFYTKYSQVINIGREQEFYLSFWITDSAGNKMEDVSITYLEEVDTTSIWKNINLAYNDSLYHKMNCHPNEDFIFRFEKPGYYTENVIVNCGGKYFVRVYMYKTSPDFKVPLVYRYKINERSRRRLSLTRETKYGVHDCVYHK